MQQDLILILDLGSEENSRLARAVRALGVYSEIHPHDISAAELVALPNLKGIILNGGKNRIVDGQSIDAGPWVYQAKVPLLLIDHQPSAQFHSQAPFSAEPSFSHLAAMASEELALKADLEPFLFEKCGAEKNWNMKNFIADQIQLIRRQVGDKKVLLALSGGVDSSVVAALLIKAIGRQLHCVHVNHGLMRKGESRQVLDAFQQELGANLVYVDAADRFLDKLAGVADPEEKRKIIGGEFIRVFEEEAGKLGKMDFLAQGTIYPDIVESGTKTVKAVKSHHNVGGLPEDLAFALVEPLKFLFKDEVRACGVELGLPAAMVYRQPFPGPGLGVRCLGAITRERLESVREADAILREEFEKAGLTGKVWQFFTVVPDFKSVGVREGKRTFQYPVILRAINTIDAMTAEVERLDWAILQKITDRILAEVPGVNRVLYDLSPKPPATIEWE
ncbi:MAG: glutamine-hydrolyzing GMP synthase [Peptococcaceae bacterium]|nr:glutamine-hydrolyzing GMP synthase [Peptococcaceae bacterium]